MDIESKSTSVKEASRESQPRVSIWGGRGHLNSTGSTTEGHILPRAHLTKEGEGSTENTGKDRDRTSTGGRGAMRRDDDDQIQPTIPNQQSNSTYTTLSAQGQIMIIICTCLFIVAT